MPACLSWAGWQSCIPRHPLISALSLHQSLCCEAVGTDAQPDQCWTAVLWEYNTLGLWWPTERGQNAMLTPAAQGRSLALCAGRWQVPILGLAGPYGRRQVPAENSRSPWHVTGPCAERQVPIGDGRFLQWGDSVTGACHGVAGPPGQVAGPCSTTSPCEGVESPYSS